MTHGDAAPRNLVVPRDDPFSPVWIDLWPEIRDVECPVTWKEAIRRDVLPLDMGVFMRGMLECQSCIDALDVWCQGHVSHYVPQSEDSAPPTGEAGEQDEAWYLFLHEIQDRERSLRNSVVAASIEGGLTFETNIPSNTLFAPSSLVWIDRVPS